MNKNSSFSFNKLNFLDEIELFEANQDIDYFPFHKHDSFCISIITSGTEIFENKNRKLIIPSNTISITQANEIHKNRSLSELGYNYKTIYVNSEILAYFNNGEKIDSLDAVINDDYLYAQINDLFKKENTNNINAFQETIKKICRYKNKPEYENNTRFSINSLEDIINRDFTKNIDVDRLAKKFHLSKYHFIRKFKKQTGISPKAYVTLNKIEKAKNDLKQGKKSIQDATYAYGFCHLSHFSNTFKKFYGISPKQYLTIIQNSNSMQPNS